MGKVRDQGDADEGPGREEFAQDRLPRTVTGKVRISSMVPMRRSSAQSPHGHRRDQKHEDPGVPLEKSLEIGLTHLEEIADVEGEKTPATSERWTIKYIGHGRSEI